MRPWNRTWYCDSLGPDSPDKSYDYWLRRCRRVIERNRLAWARDELSKSTAQGGRAIVNKGKGMDGDKDKDKNGKGRARKTRRRATTAVANPPTGVDLRAGIR